MSFATLIPKGFSTKSEIRSGNTQSPRRIVSGHAASSNLTPHNSPQFHIGSMASWALLLGWLFRFWLDFNLHTYANQF